MAEEAVEVAAAPLAEAEAALAVEVAAAPLAEAVAVVVAASVVQVAAAEVA